MYLLNEILIAKVKDFTQVNKQLHVDIEEVEVMLVLISGNAERMVTSLGTQNQEEGQENQRHDRKELYLSI